MIRKHYEMILSICTFLVLFQTSSQFITIPSELFDKSGRSAIVDHIQKKLEDLFKNLSSHEEIKLNRIFRNHLMSLSELQDFEREVEHKMLTELDNIPNFESNAVNAINNMRKSIDAGFKALDRLLENRKNKTNSGGPEITRYDKMWIQIEKKKHDEAKSALENIDNILCSMGKSIVGTVDDQMKTLHGIQKIIKDRKVEMDKYSEHLHEYMEAMKISAKTSTKSITSYSDSSVILFDETDVKEIRDLYNMWIRQLPNLDLPETKNLLKKIEENGMSLPVFCKSLAESHVLSKKAAACKKKGDKTGMDVLLKTLQQPNYKMAVQILEDSPPPSMEVIVKAVRKNFL